MKKIERLSLKSWLGILLFSIVPVSALASHIKIEMSISPISKLVFFMEAASLIIIIIWGVVVGLSGKNTNITFLGRFAIIRHPVYALLLSFLLLSLFIAASFIVNPGPSSLDGKLTYFQKVLTNFDFGFVLVFLFLLLPFLAGYLPAKVIKIRRVKPSGKYV